MDSPKSFNSPNLFDMVERAFRQFPDQTALVFNEESITYSELEVRVANLVDLIKKKVPKETLIAVSCTRSIQTIVNLMAILSSGKAYLPIDLDVPVERLQKIVTETNLRFGLPGNPHESFKSIQVADINDSLPDNSGIENVESEMAYILFTSGSTGTPKGIAISHPGLINFMEWQNSSSSSGPGFNTLHFAKLTFDISVQEIFSTLSTGGTLFIAENSTLKDPLVLLEFVEKHEINRIFFPFIALQGLCNAANAYQIYPKSLKEIMTAGEQLKVSLAVRKFFKNMKGCVLFNHYGPTETTIIITELRLDGDPDLWEDLPTIGKAIPQSELIIVSEDGKLITEPGVIGEIYIAGIGLAIGYFNNPVLTAEKFVEVEFEGKEKCRYFKSGDIAEWTANGEIKFRSRIDDQIKISGFRIELSDIEANVSKIEGIDENAVITDLYSDGELYLKLFYTTKDNSLTKEVIRRKLEKVLPEYMIPAQFFKVESFPKTTSGKVDRKALAKLGATQVHVPKESKDLDSKNIGKVLREIWKEVLQVEDFPAESNFFNLGGRSILAQKLSLEISEKLGIRFPVAFAYQYPTLNSQLKYLSEKGKTADNQLGKADNSKEYSQSRDVAVIAMAGKFPKANTIQEFWEMIKNKGEGISFFDLEEIDPLIRGEAQEPNYVRARGIVDGVENFDPEFFGMNPRLAAIMDPQQRLFMELCHEALEKAGWIANRPDFKIGVFGGSNYNSYFNKNIVFDQELLDIFGPIPILSLNEKDYLTSRTAFQLDLKGPAVSVYSACSTSLLAVAQAVESIRNGQCVAALAGGSSVTFPVKSGQFHEEGAVFSSDGHCRPFDADSSGTMFCDGAGIVLLKSYEQAVADGDPIFAVIKGVAVNNDGSVKANFTSPSVLGQAEVIKSAIADANIEPSQIGLIEAHGTATPIGDPIEIEGLKLAFGENVPYQTCSISSVKSNIGHLTAAAGIAGLIKAICALHEKVLPASNGYENPNPEIDFEHSPFFVQKETEPWTSDRKRIAGVSSFGFGGTNVHVIVEEYTENQSVEGTDNKDCLVTFSAKTEKSLTSYAKQLHQFVAERPALNLSQLSHNLLRRTAPYNLQQSLQVSSRDQLLDLLQKVSNGEINPIQRLGDFSFPVFLFPGQGAQYLGMGKSLYESNEVFRQAFDQCCDGFDKYLPTSLKFEIFEGSSETLANTRYTQPAIFTVSYSLSMALIDMGIQPAAFCGHSIGEYVGAHLAGVFTLEEVIKVVAYRGKLISELPGGNMLSVRSKTDIIQEILPEQLSLAAHNSPNLCVVSGPVEAIEDFKAVLDGYGIPSQVLKTSHAFHSAMMDGALKAFSDVAASVDRQFPKLPVMSTQTGKWLSDAEAQSVEYWTGHLRNAVLFSDAAANLLQELPEAFFIEVGPGNVLNSLMQQQPEGKKYPVIQTLSRSNTESEKSFLLDQLGVAKAKGAKIDLISMLGFTRFEFLDIPTYAFDKKLCWNQNGALANPYFQKKGKLSLNGNSHKEVISIPLSKHSGNSTLSSQPAPTRSSTSHRYFGKLRDMLESASGVSISENDLESSFFELGLDSLILTQFTFSIKNEFGVQISFRQLNDTHNTPKSILDFLDEKLPQVEGEVSPIQQEDQFSTWENSVVQSQTREVVRLDEPSSRSFSSLNSQNFAIMRGMLESASGVVISEDDLDSSFFELGLDSLILTQFVFSLKKEFGVQISFRQLNDSLNTPKSVLDFLEETLSKPSETELPGYQEQESVGFESSSSSMSLIKQELAEITQQVKEIKNGTTKTVFSQKDSSDIQNKNSRESSKSEDQPSFSESSISPLAKKFLETFEADYFNKTSKSRIRINGKIQKFGMVERQLTPELNGLSYPILADRLSGSKIFDLNGNEYLDWTHGKGANLFGNNPSLVTEAIKKQLEPGNESSSIGANLESIKRLVSKLCQVEVLGICATESEAKQSALHLARVSSSRQLVVKFVISGDPSLHMRPANSKEHVSQEEIILEYGSHKSLEIISQLAEEIAAVWVDPILGNSLDVLPKEFLKALRTVTESLGICLIFDETVTGFRVHPGGVQQLVGVQGDLVVYGAMDSAGFPLSILGGRSKWLENASVPFQRSQGDSVTDSFGSSTFHPLALAITNSYLKEIDQRGQELQDKLDRMTDDLVSRINDSFRQFNCPYQAVNFKSIWKIKPKNHFPYWEILFTKLRHEGIFIWENEVCYMTEAHTPKDIDFTIQKLESVLEQLIENELVIGDLPDLEEVLMDIKNPPFPGAKIGFDEEGNPIWINPSKK